MYPPLLTGHGKADLLDGRILAGILAHDLPLEAHQDTVGHLQDLVEVGADEQDTHAAVTGRDHLVVDEAGRADVQTTGGMGGHQQHGIGLKLAGQNDLLLVAAGQAAHVLLH